MFNAMNEKQLLRLCFSAALCMGTLSVSAASTEVTGSSYSVQQANVKQVSGQVLDENGEPIIGVTVTLKGTKTAVPTDVDGNFSLKAPAGSKLVITYLGYSTVEVNADEGIKVTMKPDTEVLNEVVVTALGIKKEAKSLSYNVQQLGGDAVTKVKDANFVNSLNGKVAGVQFTTGSAGVGGSTRVVMRGAKSLTGNNGVLYVWPAPSKIPSGWLPLRSFMGIPSMTSRASTCSPVLRLPPSMVPTPPTVSSSLPPRRVRRVIWTLPTAAASSFLSPL